MNIKLVGKTEKREKTIFPIKNVMVGEDMLFIAGPCSVESEEQIFLIAELIKKAGANMLRGGTYKPRTSPYSFQGLGRQGLEYLKAAGEAVCLPVVSEVVDTRDVFLMCEYVDILQVGARNMQNFALLKEVGRTNTPVLLKRGMHASIEEWLNCAEYIMNEGNEHVILCERGIRTFETYTRNTLDLSAVAALKNLTHLPVVTDPSHATGRIELIEPMCLSSITAGCDGVMIEVHNAPHEALSDGDQSLTPAQFADVMKSVISLQKLLAEIKQ